MGLLGVGLDQLRFYWPKFGFGGQNFEKTFGFGIIDGIILRHTDMTCDLDLLNILEASIVFQFVIPRFLSS